MSNKLFKSIGLVFIVSLITKIFGFLREVIVAYYFGTTETLDAFLIAFTIPTLLFDGIGAALSTSLIPILSYSKFNNRDDRNTFLSTLIILITIGLSAFTILFIYISPFLVKIVAPGFKASIALSAINYTQVMMPIIICSGIAYIFMAFLQQKGFYNSASIMGFTTSLSIMFCVIIFYNYLGIYSLIVGTLMGAFIQILVFLPYLKKYSFKFKRPIKIMKEHKELLTVSIPVFIGSLIIQINITIDRILASGLPSGSISALNYASKVNTLLIGTTIMAVSAVVFPMMSKLWADKNGDLFFKSLRNSIAQIIVIMLPLSSFLSILSVPIITILFQRGAFDSNATALTSLAFSFSVFILIGLSVREILNKALYSMQDTKGPLIGTIVLVLSNVVLALILVPLIGIGGLTLATAIANIVAVVSLLIWFRWKYEINPFESEGVNLIKSFFSTLISSIIIYSIFKYVELRNSENFMLIIETSLLILVGSIFYLLINLILKEKYTIKAYIFIRKKWEGEKFNAGG